MERERRRAHLYFTCDPVFFDVDRTEILTGQTGTGFAKFAETTILVLDANVHREYLGNLWSVPIFCPVDI